MPRKTRDVAEVISLPKEGGKRAAASPYHPKKGRRIFTLDLSDHVANVWDDSVPLVQQCTVEGVGIARDLLATADTIRKGCDRICKEFNLNVAECLTHQFGPGFTVVYILGESHLAVHSWPEKGYLHMDLVTCSKQGVDPRHLADTFASIFRPISIRAHKIYY